MASLNLDNLQNDSTGDLQPQAGIPVVASSYNPAESQKDAADVDNWLATTRGMANGDMGCFMAFYEAHFELMFREARRLLGRDENTCLDIVQDAFLKAMRAIRPIESHSQLQQWTRMVVRTTALDWLRKKHRRREMASESLRELAVARHDDTLQNDLARMIWIEEQLRATEPEIRHMLSLRYRLGWTLQKIADHLGIKPGTVDGRIRRAVDNLKQQARANTDEL
jgi:RNA polymerase sigma factor (sigma-70 family)